MPAKKLQFDFSMKSVLSDERLFDIILANMNRKSSITAAHWSLKITYSENVRHEEQVYHAYFVFTHVDIVDLPCLFMITELNMQWRKKYFQIPYSIFRKISGELRSFEL